MPPASLQAFTILILGIVPGFVAIRGYSRRRYRTVPDRDLYAIAGSAVVSAIWLGVVWLLLLKVGDPLRKWGVIPFEPAELENHRSEVALLGLAIVCVPFPLGSAGAILMNASEELWRWPRIWELVQKTGFFKPPTAWDLAWLKFTKVQKAGEVLVQMDDGLLVRGGYGTNSRADLSPNSPQLFLESGYGYRLDDDGEPAEVEGLGPAGVYLPGERINAVYFLPSKQSDADARVEDGSEGNQG